MLEYFCITIVLFNLLLYVLLWLFYSFFTRKALPQQGEQTMDDALPRISVLIAVRNEESNMPRFLESLQQLDYPTDRLQVLIGDDHSTDRTAEWLEQYCTGYIRWIRVIPNQNGLHGKMNVLAQLAAKAEGEYLLFTDADMYLTKDWLRGMVSARNCALVSGMTGVRQAGWFEKLQHVDMLFGQGMLKVMSDLGDTISVIGNNMMVSKKVYDVVGGYASLPFSMVEDVALLKAVKQQQRKAALHYVPATYLETKGQPGLRSLLMQRVRWMKAFEMTPWWLRGVLGLKFAFMPAVVFVCIVYPVWGWALVAKFFLSLLFFRAVSRSVKAKMPVVSVVLYEIYEPIVYFATLMFFLFRRTVRWKEREYNK